MYHTPCCKCYAWQNLSSACAIYQQHTHSQQHLPPPPPKKKKNNSLDQQQVSRYPSTLAYQTKVCRELSANRIIMLDLPENANKSERKRVFLEHFIPCTVKTHWSAFMQQMKYYNPSNCRCVERSVTRNHSTLGCRVAVDTDMISFCSCLLRFFRRCFKIQK